MTKEQEAIEKLTNGEKIDLNILIRKFKREGIENFVVTKKEYIETVLNMLKENSAEIEQKNTELAEKNAEIERLNRQIDLMAEQLKIPEPTMKIESFDIKPETKFGMRYLNKEEVKQYFERKVKND